MSLRALLGYLAYLNGMYDVACSLTIIFIRNPKNFLANLHITMFKDHEEQLPTPLSRRLLAYWIFTYGMVRMTALNFSWYAYFAVACTYFVEGMALSLEELLYKNTVPWKSLSVSVLSCMMGIAMVVVA